MSEADPEDVVGSLAEEAAKLFGALSSTLGSHGQGPPTPSTPGAHTEHTQHVGSGGAECEWCPLCRTVRAVRELSPEVKAHLSVAASSLAQAAAGILATVAPDRDAEAPGFENIDLDDTDADWPTDG